MITVNFKNFGNETFSAEFDKVSQPQVNFDEIELPNPEYGKIPNAPKTIKFAGRATWEPIRLIINGSEKFEQLQNSIQKQLQIQYKLSHIASDPDRYYFDFTFNTNDVDKWDVQGALLQAVDWDSFDATSDEMCTTLTVQPSHVMHKYIAFNENE